MPESFSKILIILKIGPKKMENELNYFKKVPNSEKKEIFKLLVQNKLKIIIKPEHQEEVLTYQVISFYEDSVLLRLNAESAKLSSEQSCFISFILEEDRYYCTTQLAPQGKAKEGLLIDYIKLDLFVLQRRKSLRISIPDKFPAYFNIIEKGTLKLLTEGQVIDFSSGGVKVKMKKQPLTIKSGDVVKGVLHLSHRRPLEVDVAIRHIEVQADYILFGAQFFNMTKLLENKMLILNMDLHREIFVKYSNNSNK